MNNAGEYHCAGSHNDLPSLLIRQEPTVVTVGTTSVNESNLTNISIFPNPAVEYIQLEGTGLFNTSFIINNTLGQNVKIGNLINNRIDIQEFPQGQYTLTIFLSEQKTINRSFIKK